MDINITIKLDRYGKPIFNNGCKSKKELRAWVQKQNLIRKFRAFVEEKEAGLIQ